MIDRFIAFLPRLIGGLIPLIIAAFICTIAVIVWRFILTRFTALSHDDKSVGSRFTLRTLPFLAVLIVMMPAIIAALGIWDIEAISAPLAHYLSIFIHPSVIVPSLIGIGSAHLLITRPK